MDPQSGGPCQGIRNSILHLKNVGVENEVVCLDEPHDPYLRKDSFQIHALGRGLRPWCYNRNLLPWLLENLHRFDFVIVHGLWLYPTFAALRALKEFRRKHRDLSNPNRKSPKFFVMPHGMLDPYFQTAKERRIKKYRNWIYWKLVEGAVVNYADGLLFTCESELLLARKPFRPYRPLREINAGYGTAAPPQNSPHLVNAFLKTNPQLKNQAYILFLSRIHEKKGVDLLIKAYGKLLSDVGTPRATIPKLVVAGPGLQSGYGQQILALVSAMDLGNQVSFPGMLSGDEKWGAFYGSEAFILPSHQENFGIAVVEALSCAKPVLISTEINICKEIQASGSGLVEEDNLDGVYNLLKQWVNMHADEKKGWDRMH